VYACECMYMYVKAGENLTAVEKRLVA